ncbi:putative F-box protein At3g23960 [Daucus carota subsp. sativus]|nr:PREDICTED: putative F-box protein At3g23960 [Daucus carota subsp. sativus]
MLLRVRRRKPSISNITKMGSKKEKQLPEDVLFSDIFTKLSAKSVLALKPVKKSWYSSIKNPEFVDRFLANSFNRPDGTSLLLTTHDQASGQQYFISSTTDERLDSRPVCLLSVLETGAELSVSQNVNGMFLVHTRPHETFYRDRVDDVYVFNPSTREYLSLPPLPNRASKTWPGSNMNMISYFFGFDVGSKDYKVVGVCCDVGAPGLRVEGEVELGIFGLAGGLKAWRVVNVDVPVSFNPCTPGICVNGAIHWLVKDKRVILAFDLGLERFRVIKLGDGIGIDTLLGDADGDGYGNDGEEEEEDDDDREDEFEEETSVWPCLIQVGSYLAVLEYDDVELRMWVLKDYQNEQWVMESMDYPYDWNLMHALPCGSSHTSEFFLCLNHNTGSSIPKIVCCDMERSTYRRINFVEQFEKIDSSTVSVSLVGCYPENIMPLPKI